MGDTVSFVITVSAGGYVRSVAHELGQALGCGGHLSSLRRTRAAAFTLDDAWTLEELEALGGKAGEALLHPRTLLPDMPCVTADAMSLGRLRNGAQVNLAEFSDAALVKIFAGQQELAGIGRRIAGTLFQPVIVMN